MLVALVVRSTVAFAIHFYAPYGLFAEDNWGYAWWGNKLLDYWQGKGVFPWYLSGKDTSVSSLFYFEVHATVFAVMGYTPLFMAAINCVVGVITVSLSYKIAQRLTGEESAFRVAWLVALYPSLVLWSSMNLRDIWVILASLLLTLSLLEYRDGHLLKSLLACAAGLLGIHLFRGYLLPLVSIGMLFGFTVMASRSKNYLKVLLYVTPFLGLGALFFLWPRIQGGLLAESVIADVSSKRGNLAEGNGAYYTDTKFNSLADVIRFLPIGVTYFLLAPFPWMISSLRQLFTLPESLFWYWLLTKIPRGVVSLSRKSPNSLLMLSAQILVLVIPYSLVSSNMGTGYRHRALILPFMLIFAVEGWRKSRRPPAMVEPEHPDHSPFTVHHPAQDLLRSLRG